MWCRETSLKGLSPRENNGEEIEAGGGNWETLCTGDTMPFMLLILSQHITPLYLFFDTLN